MATKNNTTGKQGTQSKKEQTAKSSSQTAPVNTVGQQSTGATEENANPDLTGGQDATLSDDKQEGNQSIDGLQVQSRQAGFRRAGRAWPAEATFVALDELTEEQVKAIDNEPMLIVTRVTTPEAD